MLKRSIRKGIAFTHVMGDSGSAQGEYQYVISAKLTGIFRMKKGNLKYRIAAFPFITYTADGK